MLIKFISWNVNGIRALAKKPQWEWLWHTDAQIIALQETKAALEQLAPEIAEHEGWRAWWDSSSVRKGYSGVGVFSRLDPLQVQAELPEPAFQGEGRLLHLEYPWFHFFNGYFPNGGAPELDADGIFTGNFKRVSYKMGFFEAFFKLAETARKTKPVIVCGDFNIAHRPIDLAKPKENAGMSGFLPIEREWLDKFVAAGYVDSFRRMHGELEGKYTWWSYQNMARRRNNGWRIDYFFVSEELAPRIREARIYDEVAGSDHCPVGITMDV